MELHAPVGQLFEGWHQENAEVRVAAFAFPGGSFYATMGDGVFSVVAIGYIAGVGRIVGGRSGDADKAIVQVVGGGMLGARSWSVWRTIEWSRRAEVPTRQEREQLDGRASFLREAIRRWEAAAAAHPGAPMRGGVEQWREELKDVEVRLELRGILELVVYVGYARRWKGNQFVLPG